MALLTTERLLDEVKNSGRKVNTQERRQIVRYLRSVNPEMTNVDMANLFDVSEGAIRKDIAVLRKEMADEIAEDDVSLVISDIVFNFKRQLRDLEVSKAACKAGTTEYRLHSMAIFELEKQKTALLQQLGFLPKNLGNMTVTNYEYAAVVVKGDAVETRPLTMFDDNTQAEIRARGSKALPRPAETIIDAEVVESSPERQVEFGDPQDCNGT